MFCDKLYWSGKNVIRWTKTHLMVKQTKNGKNFKSKRFFKADDFSLIRWYFELICQIQCNDISLKPPPIYFYCIEPFIVVANRIQTILFQIYLCSFCTPKRSSKTNLIQFNNFTFKNCNKFSKNRGMNNII